MPSSSLLEKEKLGEARRWLGEMLVPTQGAAGQRLATDHGRAGGGRLVRGGVVACLPDRAREPSNFTTGPVARSRAANAGPLMQCRRWCGLRVLRIHLAAIVRQHRFNS